ncbi:tRNA-intron lyase [Candidatus Woesearchaeota archaeon]|nr:tRNA-intron lyase [Candidatus Woesearchaeota archaeon]
MPRKKRKTKKKTKQKVKKKPKKLKKKSKEADIKLKEPIKGYIIGNKIVVTDDYEEALAFYNRSAFGEIHGVKKKQIEFSLVEALYLLEREKMKVYSGTRTLNFEQFVRKANRLEPGFWTRYQVYRDIRTRGYITKTALKFGADFRVYTRGKKPGEAHAKWVLFATAESDKYTWRQFAAMNRVAHSTRKKLLIGIVDEEGEVTFYECRWKRP